MAREYYRCLFVIGHLERLLLWYSNDRDGVYVAKSGTIPTFSSIEALDSFAEGAGLPLKRETPILHDLDVVEAFVSVGEDFDCNHILAAWNLFGDVARSVGSLGEAFLISDKSLNPIYDKVFHGCNLPAMVSEGRLHTPAWSHEERESIREIMKSGISIFRATVDPKNKLATKV